METITRDRARVEDNAPRKRELCMAPVLQGLDRGHERLTPMETEHSAPGTRRSAASNQLDNLTN